MAQFLGFDCAIRTVTGSDQTSTHPNKSISYVLATQVRQSEASPLVLTAGESGTGEAECSSLIAILLFDPLSP